MRRRRTPRLRAGFTLAEVLLTLLIMGGIMVSITQILTAARVSRDTIHYIQETELAGPAILDLIERDLRGVFTFDRPRQDHFRVVNRVMLGLDGDSLDFVTTTDSLLVHMNGSQHLSAAVNEVGYRLRPNPTNDDFLEIYRRESPGLDDKPFEGGRFSFLHDRVKSFDVQVFAEDGPDAEPLEEWGRSGQDRVGLPARVELTLTLELAGRLPREQLNIVSVDRRTITYRRIVRLPQSLRVTELEAPVPRIPAGPSAGSQGAAGGQSPGGGAGGGGGGGGAGGGGVRANLGYTGGG